MDAEIDARAKLQRDRPIPELSISTTHHQGSLRGAGVGSVLGPATHVIWARCMMSGLGTGNL